MERGRLLNFISGGVMTQGNDAKKIEQKKSIIAGWSRITKEYRAGNLNDHEKAQLSKAQFDEAQARKTRFVLGEPIRNSY